MELPREILPLNGLPKSRIGKDFFPPTRSIMGYPTGLPHLNGRVVLTDGFEYLVRCHDGRMVVVHVEWFEETTKGRTNRRGSDHEKTSTRDRGAATLESAAAMVADLL